MKKVLVILMTLAMVVSCFAGFAVSSSAAELEYVEEAYNYVEAVEADFGTHTAQVGEDGTITGEYTLGTYWTYEWLDVATGVFSPMSAFFATTQTGWAHGGWANFYTSNVESAWTKMAATYCSVASSGKRMHPGDAAGSTITFLVPATGVISFDASIAPYGTHASDSDNGGDAVWVYLNDKKVWPENDEDAVFYSDTASKTDPKVVSLASFEVTAGDKLRFVLTTKPGTTNGSKGCDLVDLPVVTYHSAKKADGSEMPVGNPNGEPPLNVLTTDATIEGCKVTWDAAKNAKGYNLYIAGEKINTELVTETSYTITGLEHKTLYEVTVTTVTNSDKESEPCAPVSFRTKKDPTVTETPVTTTTDTTTTGGTDTTDTSSQAPVTTTNKVDAPAEDNSMLWIIIAAAAAAVVVIVVVVVVISKKKKA